MTLRALRHRAVARLVSALLAFGAWLPEAHIDGVARALAWLAWALSPSLRAVGMHTLAQGLPERQASERRRVLRASAERLCRNAHQCLRVAAGRVALDAVVEIPPSTREILRPSPRGTVVATGHLGNWELLGSALASLGHETLAVVRRTRNTAVADRVTALRRALGFAEIPRGPYSALQCVRALRRDALVGLLCDQASDQASADVAFLGRPAATALGPATLARRTGARLVFAQLRPLADGRHRLECAEIQVFPDDRETLRAINDRLSAAITADPPAWVWFHDRWRDAPAPRGGLSLSLVALLALLSAQGGTAAPPPIFDACPAGSAVSHVETLATVRLGPHAAQRGRLTLPVRESSVRSAAVVVLHGGGWRDPDQRIESTEALSRRLACSLGVAVLNADYRLVQEGGGFPHGVEDVQRAALWLRAHASTLAIDPARIHALGASAGGHLALLAAGMHRPDAPSLFASVVSVSGITDLPALARVPVDTPEGRGVPALERAFAGASCERATAPDDPCVRASPVAWAARMPRTLLVHAVGDHLIPADQPARFAAAAARLHAPPPEVLVYGPELRARCPASQSVHAFSPCLLDAAWGPIGAFLSEAPR